MKPRHETSEPALHRTSRDWPARLIERAASRAPANLGERLQEEWLADLDSQAGKLSRLRFALGCCWATLIIGHDRIALNAPVARAATVQGTLATAMAAHPLHDGVWLSRRAIVLLLIVGLHVVLIAVIGSGLGTRIVATLPDRIKGIMITEPRAADPAPPPIGLKATEFPSVRPDVPLPPDLNFPPSPIESFPAPQPTGIETVTAPEPPPAKRVAGGPGVGFPSAEAFYPPRSREMREEGATAVQVCVDSQGRLSSEPQVRQSSGFARLDVGAIALAKAGSGHYRSGTDDGQPVASCFAFRIRFSLR